MGTRSISEWAWTIYSRLCSITGWVTCPNPTTSPPAVDWASRSNSTTIPSSATQTTLLNMREEKVIMDFPEAAEKIIAANAQKHHKITENSDATKVKKFDPNMSSVLLTLKEQSAENTGPAKRGV